MRQMRKHYARNRKRLAQMRAAKERKRMERATRGEVMPDVSGCFVPTGARSGFVVSVRRLADGKRTSFRIFEGLWGLDPSITSSAKRLASILKESTALPT